MQITLFRALKSLKLDDVQAAAVVSQLEQHVESAVNANIKAVQGEIKSVQGELVGLRAAIDALRNQMNSISVMMGVIGLAIAAAPIIAKFVR